MFIKFVTNLQTTSVEWVKKETAVGLKYIVHDYKACCT
jgi:hypothetical protein